MFDAPIDPSRAFAADGAVPSRLHCLVVEDNPTNQFVIALFLRKLGVTHDLATRGAEALAALADRRFDLVLMDIEMPMLDGYATTREWRRREAAQGRARTPVIALSADALPESRARAFDAGMDDFLTKPLAIDALRATIRDRAGQPYAAVPPALRRA
jgi:CheY-like chemotaxis protein